MGMRKRKPGRKNKGRIMRVAVIGNGIQANMGVRYLNRMFGDKIQLYRIGPEDRGGLPVVGESTIEITARFLEECMGLTEYLRDHHYPKYALTYYFKIRPDDPSDRTYSVHCNERAPRDCRKVPGWTGPMDHPPSWQLNREVFDRDIRRMNASVEAIQCLDGMVTEVEIRPGGKHRLSVMMTSGAATTLDVDWVLDVSGRHRLLARQFDLTVRPDAPRDVFWFRLEGFDRSLLKDLEAWGPEPAGPGETYHYDRYYSTHHFMCRGGWIWMIPMKGESGLDRMSIGFSYMPELAGVQIRNMEDFLRFADGSHTVIADLVRSGHVDDTNLMRRYPYTATRFYSPDRWAIVGDAAYSPDPLFSNGLAFGSIQWEQIGAMLARDLDRSLSPEYVLALSDALSGPVNASQKAITTWYPTMHDPWISAIRLNWIEIAYFYLFLPMVVNECHFREDRLGLFSLLAEKQQANAFDLSEDLLEARQSIGDFQPEHFLYIGKEKVNLRAMEIVSDIRELYAQGAEGGKLRNAYARMILDRVFARQD